MTVEDTIAAGKPADAAPADSASAAASAAPVEAGKPADAAPAVDGGKPADKPGSADDAPAGIWGDDWRDKLAKGDAKKLERLNRFASPEALLEAQENAARKISEGLKPKGKPGDKATDADWQAYRKENGIPEVVDDYVKAIALPDGRQIGEDDKPALAFFSERALKKGVAPADMAVMVDSYYAMQEEQVAEVERQDKEFGRASRKALMEEYGADFDTNVAAMRPYFDGVNPDLFENLMGGRMGDGSKIGDHPDVVKFFIAKAVAENPLASVVTPTGAAGVQAMEDEIKAMETRMREDRVNWHRDEKAQARYRQLIETRDRLKR